MIPGIAHSILASVLKLKPSLSVILGLVFYVIAAFQSGELSGAKLIEKASKWCLILTDISCGNRFANGAMLLSWVSFEER